MGTFISSCHRKRVLLASETSVQLWTTLAHCCGKPWPSLWPFTCILEVSVSHPQETCWAWPKTLTKYKNEICYTWTYFTSSVSLRLGLKYPIIIYKGGVYDTWGVWDQINQVLFAHYLFAQCKYILFHSEAQHCVLLHESSSDPVFSVKKSDGFIF